MNIKIGYSGAYIIAPQSNAMIGEYNLRNADILNEPMPSLRWMHGIDMGIRYSWEYFKMDLSWESKGNTLAALEIHGTNVSEKKLFWRLNQIVLGGEFVLGTIGLGSTIEQGFCKLESNLPGTSRKQRLASAYPLSSKVFISIHLPGSDHMSFTIRPYFSFQWNNGMEMEGLANYLGNANQDQQFEKITQVGVSFSFYNGLQRRK